MVPHAVGASAGEVPIEHTQIPHLVDFEVLPPVRDAATARTADLIAKQAGFAAADAVVVRLDDPSGIGLIEEFDETSREWRRRAPG